MPSAIAGVDQSFAYSLPRVVTLSGSGSGGTIVNYQWFRLFRPPGSSAALSSSTAQAPTFTADVTGSYYWFLKVQDNNGVWSEANPLKAPTTAFVRVTIRSQGLDISYLPAGFRNWHTLLNDAIAKLEAPIAPLSAHIAGGGSGKHTDSQISYTRANVDKKNIQAGDNSVLLAINRLDDVIAALSGLTTTDKTSVVAAMNELHTKMTTGAISSITSNAGDSGKLVKLDAAGKLDGRDPSVDGAVLDAAVAASAGAGDAAKLVKLDGAGKIDGTIHGSQAGGALHANASGAAAGFMTSAQYNKLDGIEANADVTDEANVLAALAASNAEKNVNGGKVSDVGTPSLAGDAVPLVSLTHGANGVSGQWILDGEQYVAIEDGETVSLNDIVEIRDGSRVRTAGAASTTVLGIARSAGTGDAGGTVKCRVKVYGRFSLIVRNGDNTTAGRRVKVSATANEIAQASAVEGSFGIALQTIAGDGVATCDVYLQPIGVIA